MAVYRHSRGFPRLINTICENALIIAYARQINSVTPDIIEDVAREFRLDIVTSPPAYSTSGHNRKASSGPSTRFQSLSLPQRAVGEESDLGLPSGIQ